jgi:hypothetical protein
LSDPNEVLFLQTTGENEEPDFPLQNYAEDQGMKEENEKPDPLS